MIDGMDCTCSAWYENECGCGADWTTQETYDLRKENKTLKDFVTTDNFKVTRFVVVDHTTKNPALAAVGIWRGVNVELSYQDDGRTLKVFLKDKEL
jgi:hypothetical protein